MQPSSMMRSPSPAFKPVVSVSSTTRRIRLSLIRRAEPCKGPVPSVAVAVAVDVRADDRSGGAAYRAAGAVHEPQPHQADEEAAGRGRGRHGRQRGMQLPRAPRAPVDLCELARELGAAAALAVELAPQLAHVLALEGHDAEGFARRRVI